MHDSEIVQYIFYSNSLIFLPIYNISLTYKFIDVNMCDESMNQDIQAPT